MNLCIVSLQAVLFAVVLVHYHYINEVEAGNIHSFSNGNWFSSVEKKIELVQDRMSEAYEQIKEKAQEILAESRNFMHEAIGTSTINKSTVNKDVKTLKGRVRIYDLLKNSQERKDLLNAYAVTDATKNKTNGAEPETQVIMEKQEIPNIKRKTIKKHKKKLKVKHYEPREYVPHEQRVDASVEQDKLSYGKSTKRLLRKSHKKRDKGQDRIHQRKFVKTLQRESNSSESDEGKKRKPVDIIVHIKMNE